jgi:S1-C subfamily serine protease
LITAIEGKPVTESDALARAIARKRPGDTISVKIFRGGRALDVAVKLGEVPEARF